MTTTNADAWGRFSLEVDWITASISVIKTVHESGNLREPHTAAFLGALEERAAALREAFIELRANG
jgi:hypothetical protein